MKTFLILILISFQSLTFAQTANETAPVSEACMTKMMSNAFKAPLIRGIREGVAANQWTAASGQVLIRMQAAGFCEELTWKEDKRPFCVRQLELIQNSLAQIDAEVLRGALKPEASAILKDMQHKALQGLSLICNRSF